MKPFWTMSRLLLERRGALILAVAMAFVSAMGLGAGLLSLGPMMEQILGADGGVGLQAMAQQHNAAGGWEIPSWIVGNLPADRFGGVQLLIILIWCLTVVGATANFLHQYLSQTLVTRTIATVRQRLFDHVLTLPLSKVVQRGPSEYVSRIIRDSAALEAGFISLLGKSVAQLTKGIAALAVALIFDWQIVVAAVIVGPILAIVIRKLAKRIRRGSKGSLTAQQELLRLATERVQGLRAIKTSGGEPAARRRFDEINEEVVRNELKMRTAKAMSSPIVETLAILVLGSLALIAAKKILSGAMPFDDFILSIGSLAVAGASLRPLTGIINELNTAAPPAQRILDVLSEDAEPAGGESLARHGQSIVFDTVQFTYPGADAPALTDISLEIPFGSHVAIVGPNGSGKTTLLGMLPRLLHPQQGSVLIDGVNLEQVSLKSLRDQIGVVTQDAFIVQGTILDNILLGRPDASRKDVIAAAKAAHADAFVQAMPGTWDATVSEQGASLSGGQRQRLSIARALLREPAILILDEATSQVDSESEAAIAAAIKAIQGRTVLVIAHRLATVLDCDRIVVMDQGRIVDAGTHDELLARCDLYERLIRTQLVAVES